MPSWKHLVFLAASFLVAPACGLRSPRVAASTPANVDTRRFLCGDIGERACLERCSDALSPKKHAECLIDLRFASDPAAASLARRFFERTGTLPGVNHHVSIEGFRGTDVALAPALPVGSQRRHLEWLEASLDGIDQVLESLRTHARRPLAFDPRPRAFMFFQTEVPSYPSAYCWEDAIAYNVQGPLHDDFQSVHETLVHELFHINDARHGTWSTTRLADMFDAIVVRCQGDHECLRPFAPHPSVVDGGTFYAFDPRTGDVREYAAEIALRYYLEQQAVLSGGPGSALPSFKCQTSINRVAWDRVVDEFFGGVDLSPDCP